MPTSPPPSRAAIRSQQDNPAKITVTVAQPWTLRIHDCAGARLATSTGQTAVVTTQLTVKARWRDVGPVAGSGVAARPPVEKPARISRMRADMRTAVRPAPVAI